MYKREFRAVLDQHAYMLVIELVLAAFIEQSSSPSQKVGLYRRPPLRLVTGYQRVPFHTHRSDTGLRRKGYCAPSGTLIGTSALS